MINNQNLFISQCCTICGSKEFKIDNKMQVYKCIYCDSVYEKKQEDNKMYIDLQLANNQRQLANFDKAEELYKEIIKKYQNENLTDVFWNLFLCEENVVFEGVNTQFPSFYNVKTSTISVMDNASLKYAIQYASVYEKDKVNIFNNLANQIDYAKKMFVNIKNNTAPYDIFICFKNKDDNGNETVDRRLAYKIYNKFSNKYNIFFSEESLNNLKTNYRDYEPNIFYALYTAKVMLLICSNKDYLHSKWLKNEWNRFTEINSTNACNKCLIPIFERNFDACDLPKELWKLQGIKEDIDLISNLQIQLETLFNNKNNFNSNYKNYINNNYTNQQNNIQYNQNNTSINQYSQNFVSNNQYNQIFINNQKENQNFNITTIRCPICDTLIDFKEKKCKNCSQNIIFDNISQINKLDNLTLKKYLTTYNKIQDTRNIEILLSTAMVLLKLKQYSLAIKKLEQIIEIDSTFSDSYFYMAICELGGKRPFVNTKVTCDNSLNLLQSAIDIKPNMFYYGLMAFITKDFYENKYLKKYPTSNELFSCGFEYGLNQEKYNELIEFLK